MKTSNSAAPAETAVIVGTVSTETPKLALRAEDACKALSIGRRMLWSLTNSKQIPHIRIGRSILYPIAAIEAWLDERTINPKKRDMR